MPGGASFSHPHRLVDLTTGDITYIPVISGRLEFAMEVRQRILAFQPEVLGVELPAWLEDRYRQAIDRLPQMSAILAEDESGEDASYLVIEPADPFIEAVRTSWMAGSEIAFLEPDSADRPTQDSVLPDSSSIAQIGYSRYVEAWLAHPAVPTPEMTAHAQAMAWRLQGAAFARRTVVVVSFPMLLPLLEAMQVPQEEPPALRRPRTELVNPHPDCLAEITQEMPYLQARYERYRISPSKEGARGLERALVQYELMRDAERNYGISTGDSLQHWHRKLVARFARNLALLENRLSSGLYDLTVAARSIVDDNFAWEVWQTANRYEWQQEASELETVDISGSEVFVNTRKLRLRRRLPRKKQQSQKPRGFKKREKEKRQGEWAEQLDGDSICSYPPEDLQVEDYGRFLKTKAKSMLSEERQRVEPFTSSMLDGLDIRETVRNWYQEKLYVRGNERVAGEVGAVVVIFDEDRADHYPYLTTWLGEHQNESDMAFYATNPFDHMIGPGIGRGEYGGFLMALPPRRMFDVWSDPDYDLAETKAERLLLAALDYSIERHIVYAAKKPPRPIFRSIAARMGRSILYLPLGQLAPAKLKKIRVVHVLDSRERRSSAAKYLW